MIQNFVNRIRSLGSDKGRRAELQEPVLTESAWLSHVTGGRWSEEPSSDWKLQRLVAMRDLIKTDQIPMTGSLVFSRQPAKAMSKFRTLVGQSSDTVLMVPEGQEVGEGAPGPILYVPDVVEALDQIACSRREMYKGKVLAVTGSVGKTTVRQMLAHVLSTHHDVFKGTDNHNGLPTIRNGLIAMGGEAFATFEVARIALPGAADVLRPDIAIVTAIAEAHMADLGSLADIAMTKAQLLTGLKSSGTAIINRDTPHAASIIAIAEKQNASVVTFGESQKSDVRLVSYEPSTGEVEVAMRGHLVRYRLQLLGRHNAINSLAVLSALEVLELKVSDYLQGFESFAPLRGRGRIVIGTINDKRVTVIDEAFNANPTSMCAALRSFRDSYASSSRVLVLGDMRELGEDSEIYHRDLIDPIMDCSPRSVHLIGPNMHSLWRILPEEFKGSYSSSADEAGSVLAQELESGDVILVKASNGTGLGSVVSQLEQGL